MYIHAPIVVLYEDENKVRHPVGIRYNVPKKITDNGW